MVTTKILVFWGYFNNEFCLGIKVHFLRGVAPLTEKMVLLRQQNQGQQIIFFLFLQPNILLQQPNVLLK